MSEDPGTQIASNGIELTAAAAEPTVLPARLTELAPFDARARWKAFVPLVIALTIYNLSPFIARIADYEVGEWGRQTVTRWATWLVVGSAIEATLLAIWLALAPVTLSERLALISLTYLVWRTADFIGMIALFWINSVELELLLRMTLLEFSFFAGLAVALGAFRYFRGWQLTGADWSGPLPPGRVLRFG